jgi:hypothetical protein
MLGTAQGSCRGIHSFSFFFFFFFFLASWRILIVTNALQRNLMAGRLDELESEITKRRGKWSIFNALVSLLLSSN